LGCIGTEVDEGRSSLSHNGDCSLGCQDSQAEKDKCDPRVTPVGTDKLSQSGVEFMRWIDISVEADDHFSDSDTGVVASHSSIQGNRHSQEDCVVLLPDLIESCAKAGQGMPNSPHGVKLARSKNGKEKSTWRSFYGVYDGHNGDRCSKNLSSLLHLSIVTSAFFKEDNITDAIIDGCLQTDRIILQEQHAIGDFSGSTAVFVLFDVLPSDKATSGRFFVGNVGDSRCILSVNGVAKVLTIDHKATREDERARVEAAGSTIINNRIAGVLAVTRAFGDKEFKQLPPDISIEGGHAAEQEKSNSSSSDGPSPVLALPEVIEHEITPEDEFLVLGTDGLWDVIGSQEVISFVRARLCVHSNLRRAAAELTQKAVEMHSTDNVSIVIVGLHQTPPGCRNGDQGENNDVGASY